MIEKSRRRLLTHGNEQGIETIAGDRYCINISGNVKEGEEGRNPSGKAGWSVLVQLGPSLRGRATE